MGYRLPWALAFAFVLVNVAVAPAADKARPGHATKPALDADETDALDAEDDDQQVEPSLPDDEDSGRDDELDERSGPRVGPRSAPSLPEEEEPPPADVEPARSGAAEPASPAAPLNPLGE